MLYLFDVDGTLRVPLLLPQVGSVAHWDQRILPRRAERLADLKAAGHRLGAASNQGAIAFGIVTERRMEASMEEMNRRLGGHLEWMRFCPHHPAGLIPRYRRRCPCHKPTPGMLLEALAHFQVAPADAVYVGDRSTDRQAAAAAGFSFTATRDFFA